MSDLPASPELPLSEECQKIYPILEYLETLLPRWEELTAQQMQPINLLLQNMIAYIPILRVEEEMSEKVQSNAKLDAAGAQEVIDTIRAAKLRRAEGSYQLELLDDMFEEIKNLTATD